MKTNTTELNHGLCLTNYAILEPDHPFLPFMPSWYNVHEASLYQKACQLGKVDSWLFKRFGIDDSVPLSERVRKTAYREWVNALNQSCVDVIKALGTKNEFKLKQEKTAFFYIDSWGETSILEGVNSWRDSLTIDILPKSIVKQFAIQDLTGKIRGERNAFLEGMLLAQDLIQAKAYDNIILCGQYRAHPIHVLSEVKKTQPLAVKKIAGNNSQAVVERVGCFLFRAQANSGMILNILDYSIMPSTKRASMDFFQNLRQSPEVDSHLSIMIAHPPTDQHKSFAQRISDLIFSHHKKKTYLLNQMYGDSGCLNPTLAIAAFKAYCHPGESALVYLFDAEGGYWTVSISHPANESGDLTIKGNV